MKFSKYILSSAVCLSLVVACAPKSNTSRVVDTKTITNSDLKPSEKAEQLALAAEQLMGPFSFMLADQVAEQALQIDSKNQRAQLLRSLLKPFMKFKGIVPRIKVALKDRNKLDQFEKDLNKFPKSSFRTFVEDNSSGQPEIKDEKTAQDFLVEVRNSFNDLREFAKKNKDIKLTLNYNVSDWQKRIEETSRDCAYEQVEKGIFQIDCTDLSDSMQVKVDQAEMEALQHIAAGYVFYMNMFTSYDFTGLEKISKLQPNNDAERIAQIKSEPSLYTLRNDNNLGDLPKMGTDVVAGARWANQLKSELCPKGEISKKNRKGFVLREGLCVADQAKDIDGRIQPINVVLTQVEDVLNGGLMAYKYFDPSTSAVQATLIDVTAWNRKPVQDLKTLLPVEFNSCGNSTKLGDATLGGIYPKGDANEIETAAGRLGKKCTK